MKSVSRGETPPILMALRPISAGAADLILTPVCYLKLSLRGTPPSDPIAGTHRESGRTSVW
jgi:hypothetical protein